ncbi:hypothetical protein CBM2605_B110180 [Cupriavidus neocaledonicus]|uniref:Uncharacterized protein n=1 Tax=Cupriavidus neocaledonicus TaxID=1040979 RepID=A0ABY1V7J2_9BURK|nr:hypothetical protein CBM2605_B110180 [Cupriavidus neocaledonicus]
MRGGSLGLHSGSVVLDRRLAFVRLAAGAPDRGRLAVLVGNVVLALDIMAPVASRLAALVLGVRAALVRVAGLAAAAGGVVVGLAMGAHHVSIKVGMALPVRRQVVNRCRRAVHPKPR